MASSKEFVAFVAEQLSELGEITTRPMMGEYLLYYRGKLAGDICDNRLLVKPVPAALKLLPNAPHEPPFYYRKLSCRRRCRQLKISVSPFSPERSILSRSDTNRW